MWYAKRATTMIVRELVTKFGFQLNNAQVQNAERATTRLKQQADQAAQSFRSVVAGFFTLQAVRGLVAIGDEMQSLRSQIGLLEQPTGTAGETLDLLVDKANAARQSLANYGSFFVKAGNATKDFITSQDELLRIVDGAAIGIAASGANAVNQAQAFYQLGQAIGSPVVQMEEMNTLIDAAPDLFRELGKVIPGANNNLKKFIGTGQVTGKMLAEGLQKVADVFEERMLKMPMTVGQATIIVGNKFSRMIDRMNRDSMIITKIANTILSGFDSIENGIETIIKTFDGWDNALRLVGSGLIAATAVLAAFIAPSWAALAPWLLIGAAIALAALIIEDLMVAAEGGNSVFLAIAETIEGWYDSIVKAIDEGLAYAENAVLETIKGWSDALYRMFVETIPTAIRDAWNTVTGLPGNILDSLKSGASAITGSGSAFNVTPSAMATAGGRTIISNNTNNVNIQVPAGTGPEQVAFVKNQTQKYMDSLNKPLTTRDTMAYNGG